MSAANVERFQKKYAQQVREVIEKASVNPTDEPPIWNADTDETMARLCGLR